MDSTIFDIDTSTGILNSLTITYNVPSLSAYAVDHSDVLINGLGSHHEGVDYEIIGNRLVWNHPAAIDIHDKVRLVIYYHGIRDYRLLFQGIPNSSLVERLASFYEEAEKDFRSGAWLSYALMCGGIFEGLLFAILNVNKSFKDLTEDALAAGRIDAQTFNIMAKTRNFRNLVHANRHVNAYIARAEAMDIRTTMDKLIKNFA